MEKKDLPKDHVFIRANNSFITGVLRDIISGHSLPDGSRWVVAISIITSHLLNTFATGFSSDSSYRHRDSQLHWKKELCMRV